MKISKKKVAAATLFFESFPHEAQIPFTVASCIHRARAAHRPSDAARKFLALPTYSLLGKLAMSCSSSLRA